MSSINFKCIGPGKVLAYLRNDLPKATRSIFIVGPWLDDYFAREIIRAAPENIEVRVLVRGRENVEPAAWERTQLAMSTFKSHWKGLQARHLDLLHAKVICIDGLIAYVGSANWYYFSLERSQEIVLRLPLNDAENLDDELERLWEAGSSLEVLIETSQEVRQHDNLPPIIPSPRGPEAIQEIPDRLDVLAATVLRKNPKAWVVGKKFQKRTNWRAVSRKNRKSL
ncbi:MAG: phospholipase D-like domain-containing protein [Methanotrichaceae archaeon]|jgi:phosphatidylserine/phosphatidylglycerophosphate/cardiolipin synthase-like enzyme